MTGPPPSRPPSAQLDSRAVADPTGRGADGGVHDVRAFAPSDRADARPNVSRLEDARRATDARFGRPHDGAGDRGPDARQAGPQAPGLRRRAWTACARSRSRRSSSSTSVPPWLRGGFLGVDVFFVLSGFLITSILLTEFYDRRSIDIKNFYLRRARRLLPALFTMLAAVTLLTWLFARDELHRLRGDVVAALTYCTNWTQIVWGRSYFDQLEPAVAAAAPVVARGRGAVLPRLAAAARRLPRRATRWVVLAVPCVLAVVSLVLMASLFHVGQDTGARLLRHRHAHRADAGRRDRSRSWSRCAARRARPGKPRAAGASPTGSPSLGALVPRLVDRRGQLLQPGAVPRRVPVHQPRLGRGHLRRRPARARSPRACSAGSRWSGSASGPTRSTCGTGRS